MTAPGELLETSLQEIVLHGEAFAVAFYERLFTRFPQTRAFFANTDMFEQHKKLQESLALIVQHIQQPEALSRMLQDLGQASSALRMSLIGSLLYVGRPESDSHQGQE